MATDVYTCVICPNGCEITVTHEGTRILEMTGQKCPRGIQYVTQELTTPMRSVTSSVLVDGGTAPLCSVRTTGVVPKERILDAVREMHKLKLTAPVERGTVVLTDLLGLGVDVITTSAVDKK